MSYVCDTGGNKREYINHNEKLKEIIYMPYKKYNIF